MMVRIFLIALLFATSAKAGAPFTTAHVGEWRGVGVQSDGVNWDIVVTIGETRGRVTYPRLHCGGRWDYAQIEPDFLSARETIEFGAEFCISSGTVLLSRYENDRLIYVWCDDDNAVSAVALLERSNASNRRYEALLAATQAMQARVGAALKDSTCQGEIWLGV